ncbi:MAG: sigma-70 family RNA polymerase sigma factor [Phycisphaerae bacterium]|nr:sigma-70 family RNA polymerase sigma factor [Phycisphaerae bacterium]
MMKNRTIPAPAPRRASEADVLAEQARGGDMGAFSRLATLYMDRIVNTCWRVCGHWEDAQDLAQEAFLHAVQGISSFQGRSGFYTWLFRIAVNLSIAHRRKQARGPRLAPQGQELDWDQNHQAAKLVGRTRGQAPQPAEALQAKETQRILLAGLEELDPEQRAMIVLRDIEDLDYRQIAEVLDVPVGTVKSRLHRARMELRARLKPALGEE